MVINRVGPVSFAKLAGTLYAILGLIIGALFSLVAMMGGMMMGQSGGGYGMIFGVGAIILFPILYGVCGFLISLIGAALYNLAAGIAGGVEIDVK